MRLEQRKIVDVGLVLLERDGFEALSLAKIAAALKVQTPALYWHIENRGELYGLMAEEMLRDCLDSIGAAKDPRAWLIAFGRALRASHVRRRDAARLAASATPSEAMRTELLERIIGALTAGGLSRVRAFEAQSAVQSFVLGWSLFLSNAPVAALIGRSMNTDAAFETGLRALAEGFCASERRRAAPAAAQARDNAIEMASRPRRPISKAAKK